MKRTITGTRPVPLLQHGTYEEALRSIGRAIDYEGFRLLNDLWAGCRIVPGTLAVTTSMTSTESASFSVEVEYTPVSKPIHSRQEES